MQQMSSNFLQNLGQAETEFAQIQNMQLSNLDFLKRHCNINLNLATKQIQVNPKKTSQIVKFLALSKYLKRGILSKFTLQRRSLLTFQRRIGASPLDKIISSSRLSLLKKPDHHGLCLKAKPMTSWEHQDGQVCQMAVLNQGLDHMLLEMEIRNLHLDSPNLEILLLNKTGLDFWAKRLKFNNEEDFTDTPALGRIRLDLRSDSKLQAYLQGARRNSKMEYLMNRSQSVVERAKFLLRFERNALCLLGIDGETISSISLNKDNSKSAADSKIISGTQANHQNGSLGKHNGPDTEIQGSGVKTDKNQGYKAGWEDSEDWEDVSSSSNDMSLEEGDGDSQMQGKERFTSKQRKEWTQYQEGSPVFLGMVLKHPFISVSAKFHTFKAETKKEV